MFNFGHTAIRVFGQGYDQTYDFDRYAGGTGLLRGKCPGILRVWGDDEAFLKGQAPEGDVRSLTYKTSEKVTSGTQALTGGPPESFPDEEKVKAETGSTP